LIGVINSGAALIKSAATDDSKLLDVRHYCQRVTGDSDGAFESVARTANGKPPNTVGTPEIRPATFIDRPEGSDPEISVHVYGGLPFAAASCML